MSTGEEVKARIEAFSEEHRRMLADAMDVLSQCFGTGNGKAVVIFAPPEDKIAQIFVLNCAEHEAWALSAFAKDHMEVLMTEGMPDKEMLN